MSVMHFFRHHEHNLSHLLYCPIYTDNYGKGGITKGKEQLKSKNWRNKYPTGVLVFAVAEIHKDAKNKACATKTILIIFEDNVQNSQSHFEMPVMFKFITT